MFRHPRCLNCHQQGAPLQGEGGNAHVPQVERGPDNHGVPAMRCHGCHNESGNERTSGTPGAPHWQLAPASMGWQGHSPAEICRAVTSRDRNGDRSRRAVLKHLRRDPLVHWAWQPGGNRKPVPLAYEEFLELAETWLAGGAVCEPD